MDGKEYIFSVTSASRTVYLHPYLRLDSFTNMDSFYLCGRFSGTLKETAAELRDQFRKECERRLKKYYSEKNWFVKLLLSALAFTVTYLFFSIVVPDPLPVIDEFLLSTLAACCVYLIIEIKSSSPERRYKSYGKLREQLDACYIEPSLFVASVEALCAQIKDAGEAAAMLRREKPFGMENLDKDEARAFCLYCSWKWRDAGRLYKLNKQLEDGLPFEQHLKPLLRKYGSGEFALMVVYLHVLRGLLSAGPHV